MKDLTHLWQLAPRFLRSLLIAILVVIMAGVSTGAWGADGARSQPEQSDSQLIAARALPGIYSVPSTCSVPIIPALVTEEEIQLRQYQLDFATFIEEQANLDRDAAITMSRDVLSIERFRIDCEIMLLRAKQILDSNNDYPLPAIKTTPQEIELRKSQFDISKQLDAEEALAQEVGVASLNRVWAARRSRTDSEILLLQATVQKRLQDIPTETE